MFSLERTVYWSY